ncbi:MAG: hypothetical protein R3B90_20610 [Planctomycetaceae bacterium]
MKVHRSGRIGLLAGLPLCLLLVLLLSRESWSCPFCTVSTTLAERIEQSQTSYVARWIAGREGDAAAGTPGHTRVQVVSVFKNVAGQLRPGQIVDLAWFINGQRDDEFLLFGKKGESEELLWDAPLACSAELLTYLKNRPPEKLPATERLPYFLNFLEHPDEAIAVDAYGEFAKVQYSDVAAIREHLPRHQLREWLTTEPPVGSGRVARRAFYGMLLGLCGTPADAKAIEPLLFQPGEDFRIGMMASWPGT